MANNGPAQEARFVERSNRNPVEQKGGRIILTLTSEGAPAEALSSVEPITAVWSNRFGDHAASRPRVAGSF